MTFALDWMSLSESVSNDHLAQNTIIQIVENDIEDRAVEAKNPVNVTHYLSY